MITTSRSIVRSTTFPTRSHSTGYAAQRALISRHHRYPHSLRPRISLSRTQYTPQQSDRISQDVPNSFSHRNVSTVSRTQLVVTDIWIERSRQTNQRKQQILINRSNTLFQEVHNCITVDRVTMKLQDVVNDAFQPSGRTVSIICYAQMSLGGIVVDR